MSIEEFQILVLLSQMKFYVYVYLDPSKPGQYVYGDYTFEYEPFYVGKGQNGRWLVHMSYGGNNRLFINKIKKIQSETGNDPIVIKYQKDMLPQDALTLETMMVKSIGRRDLGLGPLCNLTNGGDGVVGYKQTDEQRKNNSIGHRQYSDEIMLEAIEKCKNNIMYKTIAEEMNIPKSTIRGWYLLSGEYKDSINWGNKRYFDEREEALKLRKQCLSYREISEILNVYISTVRYWCVTSPDYKFYHKTKYSDDIRNKVMEMRNKNIKFIDISAEMNIPVPTLKGFIRKLKNNDGE